MIAFSARSNIEHGVSQGSILGPLHFNINMIYLFCRCEENDIATIFMWYWHSNCHFSITGSAKVFNLFGNSHMKANLDEYHLLVNTKNPEVEKFEKLSKLWKLSICHI